VVAGGRLGVVDVMLLLVSQFDTYGCIEHSLFGVLRTTASIPLQDAKLCGMAVPDRSSAVQIELVHDGCDLGISSKIQTIRRVICFFPIAELNLRNQSSTLAVYAKYTEQYHEEPRTTNRHEFVSDSIWTSAQRVEVLKHQISMDSPWQT
jgi:hypothetical protein